MSVCGIHCSYSCLEASKVHLCVGSQTCRLTCVPRPVDMSSLGFMGCIVMLTLMRLDRMENLSLGRLTLAVVESRVAPIKSILCTGVSMDFFVADAEAQTME